MRCRRSARPVERVDATPNDAWKAQCRGDVEPRPGADRAIQPARPGPRRMVVGDLLERGRDTGEGSHAVGVGIRRELVRHEALAKHQRRPLHEQWHRRGCRCRRRARGDCRHLAVAGADVHRRGDVTRVFNQLVFGDRPPLRQAGQSRGQLQHGRLAVRLRRVWRRRCRTDQSGRIGGSSLASPAPAERMASVAPNVQRDRQFRKASLPHRPA